MEQAGPLSWDRSSFTVTRLPKWRNDGSPVFEGLHKDFFPTSHAYDGEKDPIAMYEMVRIPKVYRLESGTLHRKQFSRSQRTGLQHMRVDQCFALLSRLAG